MPEEPTDFTDPTPDHVPPDSASTSDESTTPAESESTEQGRAGKSTSPDPMSEDSGELNQPDLDELSQQVADAGPSASKRAESAHDVDEIEAAGVSGSVSAQDEIEAMVAAANSMESKSGELSPDSSDTGGSAAVEAPATTAAGGTPAAQAASPDLTTGDSGKAKSSGPPTERPELEDFSGGSALSGSRDISMLRDVNLKVHIELGRTQMYIEDVLKLNEGSVVELDNLAGDPVNVYVNNRLVARGEVLVLSDNFCVRISEILTGPQQVAVA